MGVEVNIAVRVCRTVVGCRQAGSLCNSHHTMWCVEEWPESSLCLRAPCRTPLRSKIAWRQWPKAQPGTAGFTGSHTSTNGA